MYLVRAEETIIWECDQFLETKRSKHANEDKLLKSQILNIETATIKLIFYEANTQRLSKLKEQIFIENFVISIIYICLKNKINKKFN